MATPVPMPASSVVTASPTGKRMGMVVLVLDQDITSREMLGEERVAEILKVIYNVALIGIISLNSL